MNLTYNNTKAKPTEVTTYKNSTDAACGRRMSARKAEGGL
jgi:hypothetical protein